MIGGAIFDRSGAYRYLLWRSWDTSLPSITWVMLNPSTADAGCLDPTIRRCLDFSRRWGFGTMRVVNLFARRASRPADLFRAADPAGPENEWYLEAATATGAMIVAGWGAAGRLDPPHSLACAGELYCLGTTRDGRPRHPLYVPADRTPILYVSPSG